MIYNDVAIVSMPIATDDVSDNVIISNDITPLGKNNNGRGYRNDIYGNDVTVKINFSKESNLKSTISNNTKRVSVTNALCKT